MDSFLFDNMLIFSTRQRIQGLFTLLQTCNSDLDCVTGVKNSFSRGSYAHILFVSYNNNGTNFKL